MPGADDTSTRRNLASAAGLLILAGLGPLYTNALAVGAMYGVRWTPDAVRPLFQLQFCAAVVVFWWLCSRVFARTTLDRVSRRQRLFQRSAAVLAGAAAILSSTPTTDAMLMRTAMVVYAVVLGWLALEVCSGHGTPLDTSVGLSTAEQRSMTWHHSKEAFLVCACGGAAASILVIFLRVLDIDGVPVLPGDRLLSPGADQVDALGHHGLSFVLGAAFSVTIEDLVIVAAITTLMTAARRPRWQIYTTVCVVEILLHAYFGLAALGFLLFAAGRVRLFLLHRRVFPLMAGHATLNLLGSLNTLPLLYRLPCICLLAAVAWWVGRHLTRSAEQQDRDASRVTVPPTTRKPGPVSDPPSAVDGASGAAAQAQPRQQSSGEDSGGGPTGSAAEPTRPPAHSFPP